MSGWPNLKVELKSLGLRGEGDDEARQENDSGVQINERTSVGQDLSGYALRTRALAKDGNFVGRSTKCCDVLIDPAKGETLVAEAEVGYACTENFLAANESECRQTVVYANADDGGAHANAILDDEREVVPVVCRAAHTLFLDICYQYARAVMDAGKDICSQGHLHVSIQPPEGPLCYQAQRDG